LGDEEELCIAAIGAMPGGIRRTQTSRARVGLRRIGSIFQIARNMSTAG
jgi:hypothetical protein